MRDECGRRREKEERTAPAYGNRLPGLALREVVDDEHFVELWAEQVTEGFVCGVRKIDVHAGLVFEGEEEAVGVAVVLVFGADVGAPLVAGDGVDLLGQGGEGVLDGFDLVRRGGVLELEEDDMAVNAGLGSGGGGW